MTQWTLTSSLLILAVLLIRAVGRDKLSARVRYALWALVLVRLLVPFNIGNNSMSILNVVPSETAASRYTETSLDRPTEVMFEQAASETADVSESAETVNDDPVIQKIEGAQTDSAATGIQKNDEKQQIDLNLLLVLWMVGMVVVGGVFFVSNVRFGLMLHRSRRFLMSNEIKIYESAAIETPCLFGVMKPAVYITPEVIADEVSMRHVLSHEQTHYRHRDHLWAALRCLCVTLHWYNPLVWIAAFVSQQDAELACDEGAIMRIGEDERTAYARTLLDLTCVGYKGMLTTATSMTGSESDLKTRVLRIVKNPKMPMIAVPIIIVIAVVMTLVLFTGRSNTDFNGVWRSEETNIFGDDSRSYAVDPQYFYEYEFRNGEGRAVYYYEGEITSADLFTYHVDGDMIKVDYESDYINEIEFRIEGDKLVSNNGETNIREYFPYERTNPAFLKDEILTIDYASSWEMTKERRVDWNDTYTAALFALFREAEVTVLDGGGKETPNHSEYAYYFHGTPFILSDGILYDEENGYVLSNIKEIEIMLAGLQWYFPEPEVDDFGMKYYSRRQDDVLNIVMFFRHGYQEERYYVPENPSEWRAALDEALKNATKEVPEVVEQETSLPYWITDGEINVQFYGEDICAYNKRLSEGDYESYYFRLSDAPQFAKLMEYFRNLYRDSVEAGPSDEGAYSQIWRLEGEIPGYTTANVIMKLSMWGSTGKLIANLDGDVIYTDLECGIAGNQLMLRLPDFSEYEFKHELREDQLIIYVDEVPVMFQKTQVALEEVMKMGDVVRVERNDQNLPLPLVFTEQQRTALLELIEEGLESAETADNVIVVNDVMYKLPILSELLDADEVTITDEGKIFYNRQCFVLGNSNEILTFLDELYPEYVEFSYYMPKG